MLVSKLPLREMVVTLPLTSVTLLTWPAAS